LFTLAALAAMTATAAALPPGEHGRGFRDGANHHLGDDSFVARTGRAPGAGDTEKVRMHEHLVYVRDRLAARPASRPELTARRGELLGYLGDYIAAGITPVNTYVPWRSPVFIDATGHICAVGYLIERSVGRDVAERVARAHRTDFLEDIAAAMPEVRAWVASSGFSLVELASIQPGYEGPDVSFLDGFDTKSVKDGAFTKTHNGITVTGAFAKKKMTGTWTVTDASKKVLGTGTFKDGAGAWRGNYPAGGKLAEGFYADNRAVGPWKFYHPSGKLAAEGTFSKKGLRDGAWRFYYDSAAQTTISSGAFSNGFLTGAWKHFDAAGKPLATATHAPKRSTADYYNDGLFLSVTPGKDGITHEMHGGIPADGYRLDGYYVGDDRLFVREDGTTYDGEGNRLSLDKGVWHAADCKWSAKRKRAAAAGDLVTVSILLLGERNDSEHAHEKCGKPAPVAAARAKKLDAFVKATSNVRTPTPAFVKAHMTVPADADAADADEVAATLPKRNSDDLAVVLASHMTWYMEWPHVDGAFRGAFDTMPGYNRERWDAEDASP
jgi:antitoxin component YwqK of YwqJK toxin-antitoxin module